MSIEDVRRQQITRIPSINRLSRIPSTLRQPLHIHRRDLPILEPVLTIQRHGPVDTIHASRLIRLLGHPLLGRHPHTHGAIGTAVGVPDPLVLGEVIRHHALAEGFDLALRRIAMIGRRVEGRGVAEAVGAVPSGDREALHPVAGGFAREPDVGGAVDVLLAVRVDGAGVEFGAVLHGGAAGVRRLGQFVLVGARWVEVESGPRGQGIAEGSGGVVIEEGGFRAEFFRGEGGGDGGVVEPVESGHLGGEVGCQVRLALGLLFRGLRSGVRGCEGRVRSQEQEEHGEPQR